ncbi:hypothetical protein SAMN05192529_10365 [Arachidicoccus rhizosphaerae]|uniref:Outer membrane lipoprotein-sorting protein n=1 Tax=Arachidicoccus rhizosphaerae TaxID=551991 RepID=A0A1H3WJR8_9BACT|nr:hypothetical protein [Arachidicoccus rhizosphaerae]SDZ87051.1 hypothetical protein SAMN05192529_10365 [Arachidicoccus rhizosphaerae]
MFIASYRKVIRLVLLLCVAISAIVQQGCITSQKMMDAVHGQYYQYKFSMRESNSRKKAVWQKDGVQIIFSPDYNRINFSVINHSERPVEIIWTKSAMVQQSDSSAIIHGGISLSSNPRIQPSSVIAKGKNLQDFILPLLLINVNGQKLSIRDIYPEKDDELSVKNDWIMHLIGQDLFKLYLTIKINDQEGKLPFTFYPIEIMRGAHSFKKQ